MAQARVLILDLSVSSPVTLRKYIDFSKPPFPFPPTVNLDNNIFFFIDVSVISNCHMISTWFQHFCFLRNCTHVKFDSNACISSEISLRGHSSQKTIVWNALAALASSKSSNGMINM